jgi:uncharacterized protein (TIGR00251 family)
MIHPALTDDGDGPRLAVRVTARAGRDALTGIVEDGDGRFALAVRLAAPPVHGAANAALIRLLARALGLPRSALTIVAGQRSRRKLVRLTGLSTGEATLRLESRAP